MLCFEVWDGVEGLCGFYEYVWMVFVSVNIYCDVVCICEVIMLLMLLQEVWHVVVGVFYDVFVLMVFLGVIGFLGVGVYFVIIGMFGGECFVYVVG